jgi:hypothetical protein
MVVFGLKGDLMSLGGESSFIEVTRVAELLDEGVLASIQPADPASWTAKCPPPCETFHNLTDPELGHEAGGPVFIFDTRIHSLNPGPGVIVYGHSRLDMGNQRSGVAAMLNRPYGLLSSRPL